MENLSAKNGIDESPLLKQVLADYRGQPFIFVSPGGNWGDDLIYLGAETLAKSIGLRWDSIDWRRFPSAAVPADAVVYLHGSGGFNRWCSGRAALILPQAVQRHPGVVIQGPHSFAEDAEYARETIERTFSAIKSRRVVLVARERRTFELLGGLLPPKVELLLDHDTAFNVRKDQLLEIAGKTRPRYQLLALRADNERSPSACRALARSFSGAVILDPADFARDLPHWVRIHAFSKSLVTDHAHSAVLGSLLEVPTTFLRSIKLPTHRSPSPIPLPTASIAADSSSMDQTRPGRQRDA
jgi:hypothetical protein